MSKKLVRLVLIISVLLITLKAEIPHLENKNQFAIGELVILDLNPPRGGNNNKPPKDDDVDTDPYK